jgi:pimeloyl-ACP methyl ester carboxylesterase
MVIAGALGLVSASYGRDISKARSRIAAGSQIAQTACGPIEYAEAGSGPTVLVVHGAGGGYDQGLDLGFDLAKNGFHVIAVSRFGYLRTPLPADGSAAAQADAHACLLDALNVRTVAVFGASAGAPSTMQFALRHPERTRAMVLVVPAAFVPRPGGAPSVKPVKMNFLLNAAFGSDFLFWAATKVARPTLIRSILGTPTSDVEAASPEERVRVEMVLDHILPISPRRDGLVNDAAVISSLPRYDLEKISVPTLAISVENDGYGTYDGARYTAANVQGAKFIGYPTGGHILVGHSREMLAEIAAFLR